MDLISNYICFNCDAPRPWSIYFQDTATPQIEGLVELHDSIMFYLFIILFAIYWIVISTISSYMWNKYVMYCNNGGLKWILTSPAIILLLIALPFSNLLYLMDDVMDVSLIFFKEGDQFHWTYDYSDFSLQIEDEIVYDSYLIPESDLEEGKLRMLEVDNKVIVPENTYGKFIISSGDAIHTLPMDEAIQGPSQSTGSTLAEGINTLNRPIADWRWFPMEHGDLYTESWGHNNNISRHGSIIVYNSSDPSDDITWVMAGENHHGIKCIGDIRYPGTVKHNMGTLKSHSIAPKIVKVDINKFLNYTFNRHTVSNGSLIIPDNDGNIVIQRA